MQKRKKQLLGLAGLVLVGVLTIVAYTIPSQDASAYESSVDIKVTVGEPEEPDNPDTPTGGRASVDIISVDGKNASSEIITTNNNIKIEVNYRRQDSVVVRLKDASGNIIGSANCAASYSSSTQTCTANIKMDGKYLAKDPRNGDKIYVEAVGTRDGVETTYTDQVEFIYRSAYIYTKSEHDPQIYDPVIYAVMNPSVKYAMIQVFDANNKSVLQTPITLNYNDVDPVTGELKITLPFKENNLPAGYYTVVLMAYSTTTPSEDSLISVSTLTKIAYSPDGSPLPPDTGSNLFQNLNISRADYLVTGLLAFGMVTIFAIILIVCRNKNTK